MGRVGSGGSGGSAGGRKGTMSVCAQQLLFTATLYEFGAINAVHKSLIKTAILSGSNKLFSLMRRVDDVPMRQIKQLAYDEAERRFNTLYDACSTTDAAHVSRAERARMGYESSSLVHSEIRFKPFVKLLSSLNLDKGGVFVDLGSGTGRAVFAAALCCEFKKLRGIEIMSGLHTLASMVEMNYMMEPWIGLEDSPPSIDFVRGSIENVDWSDADVVFANSTCFQDSLLDTIAKKCKRLKPGTIVITTTSSIESAYMDVVDKFEEELGSCISTVFMQVRNADAASVDSDDEDDDESDDDEDIDDEERNLRERLTIRTPDRHRGGPSRLQGESELGTSSPFGQHLLDAKRQRQVRMAASAPTSRLQSEGDAEASSPYGDRLLEAKRKRHGQKVAPPDVPPRRISESEKPQLETDEGFEFVVPTVRELSKEGPVPSSPQDDSLLHAKRAHGKMLRTPERGTAQTALGRVAAESSMDTSLMSSPQGNALLKAKRSRARAGRPQPMREESDDDDIDTAAARAQFIAPVVGRVSSANDAASSPQGDSLLEAKRRRARRGVQPLPREGEVDDDGGSDSRDLADTDDADMDGDDGDDGGDAARARFVEAHTRVVAQRAAGMSVAYPRGSHLSSDAPSSPMGDMLLQAKRGREVKADRFSRGERVDGRTPPLADDDDGNEDSPPTPAFRKLLMSQGATSTSPLGDALLAAKRRRGGAEEAASAPVSASEDDEGTRSDRLASDGSIGSYFLVDAPEPGSRTFSSDGDVRGSVSAELMTPSTTGEDGARSSTSATVGGATSGYEAGPSAAGEDDEFHSMSYSPSTPVAHVGAYTARAPPPLPLHHGDDSESPSPSGDTPVVGDVAPEGSLLSSPMDNQLRARKYERQVRAARLAPTSSGDDSPIGEALFDYKRRRAWMGAGAYAPEVSSPLARHPKIKRDSPEKST